MGNYSEWLRKKRLKEMQDKTDDSLLPFGAYQKKQRERQNQDLAPMRSQGRAPTYDIAPESKERSWFEKGAFEDGYQFGDYFKTMRSTGADLLGNVGAGLTEIVEGVVDAGAYLVGGTGALFGADDFSDDVKDFIKKDIIPADKVANGLAAVLNPIDSVSDAIINGKVDNDKNSLWGEKSDSVAQSAGQLLGQIGLQTVGVPWWVTSAVTSFGSAAEEAFANDASYLEAGINSVISAGAEMLTEKLFAGSGLGEKGLIKTDWLTRGISNKVMQTLAKFGVNMATEGGEEVASSFIQNLGKAVTYKREEEIDEILTDSAKFSSFIESTANQLFGDEAKAEYGEAFWGGVALGGGVNAGKLGNALKYKVDYDTGFTASEQKVFEKALNDRIAEEEKGGKKLSAKEKANIEEAIKTKLRKGYFTIDEIEDIVGGESYNSYKDSIKRQTALKEQESSLRAEIEALYKELPQKRDGARLTAAENELKSVSDELKQIDTDSLKKKASDDILNTLKSERRGEGSMLLESYSEVARKRQKLSVDTSKMDAKKAAIYKRHMESDLWNNTNRSHDFVDLLVELEAERGIKIDGIDTARLSEAGFTVEGATVNGVKTKNGEVLINLQSSKSLNSVLGHEITHVLEGTEAYKVLKDAVVKYAKSKGEYDKRLTDITKLYKKAEGADIDAELTADLVGDYLFTDEGFIKSLTEHKNLFQRIFDEVKYLCSIAVKGSNEESKLLKIKRAFEKALRESGEAKVSGENMAQMSLTENSQDLKKKQFEIIKNTNPMWDDYHVGIRSAEDIRTWDDVLKLDDESEGQFVWGDFSREDALRALEENSITVYSSYPIKNGTFVSTSYIQAREYAGGRSDSKVYSKTVTLNDVAWINGDEGQYAALDKDMSLNIEESNKSVDNYAEIRYNSNIRFLHKNFPPENEVLSEAHRLATWWARREDVSAGDRTLISMKNRWYVVEMFDDAENYYQVEGWIRKADYNKVLEDIKKYGRSGRIKSIQGSFDWYDQLNKSGGSFEGRESSLDSYKSKHGEENSKMVRMASSENKGRERSSSYRSGDSESSGTRRQGPNIKFSLSDAVDGDLAPMAEEIKSVANEQATEDPDILYSLSDEKTSKPVDKYSQNQYNLFGWARDIDAISKNELDDMYSKIHEKGSLTKFPKSSKGEAIIEVNDSPHTTLGTDNVFVFVKGSKNAPEITRVIRVNFFDEASVDVFRKDIYANTDHRSLEAYARVMGEEFVLYYDRSSSANYGEYANRTRTQQSGSEGKGNTPVNRNGDQRNGAFEETRSNEIAPDKASLTDGVFFDGKDGDSYSLSDAVDGDLAPMGRYDVRGDDVAYVGDDLAPLKPEYSSGGAQYSLSGGPVLDDDLPLSEKYKEDRDFDKAERDGREVEAPGDISVHEKTEQKMTFSERLEAKLQNSKTELENLKKQKEASRESFDKKIAELQAEYDSKKNKDTKVANNLLSRIERLKRLRDDIDSDYGSRILKASARVDKAQGELDIAESLPKTTSKKNAYERALENIEKKYVEGKNTVVTERAQELYDEVNEMEKGKRVSPLLSDILNRLDITDENKADSYRKLRTALLNVSRKPGEMVNTNPANENFAVEAMVRERIEDSITKEAEKARENAQKEAERVHRRALHADIIDRFKKRFESEGKDLDEILNTAKRMHTVSINDNTPQRVNDKTFGYDAGEILNDLTFNQVASNESNAVRWMNAQVDMLRRLSKRYNIKPGSKESAAAMMYGEGFFVNEQGDFIKYGDTELAMDFPDAKVQANIKSLANDPEVRRFYDETLNAINESRVRNGYPEIPRRESYFLHFRAMTDTFSRLGIPFNPMDIKAKDLPTDINGMTADLKPGQPYFASANRRMGNRTTYDLLGGMERYMNAAKDQIYHIDDIQNIRALRNYIADHYGQANGLSDLDALTPEEQETRIREVFDGHLSGYARFLNEYANNLAGKTALMDRSVEGMFGRRAVQALKTFNSQVGKNMVGFNVSSAGTNFISLTQAAAKLPKGCFIKAFAQTVANKFNNDGFVEQNDALIRRKGADKFAKTAWEKVSDVGYWLMSAVDNLSSEVIVRGKYNELIKNGMDSDTAHKKAGEWAMRLLGDRSFGQLPIQYNSATMGLFNKFQLEVRNQLDSMIYDTIQENKATSDSNTKKAFKITKTLAELAIFQHMFGMAYESIAGYNPAFDIISTIATLFGWDDDEDDEDTFIQNLGQATEELLGDLPYSNLITDGGRIPVANILPLKELLSGQDDYGNEISYPELIGDKVGYLLPGGYGQIKKTIQGLSMFDDDLPLAGSYTDSGNLRFPVEDTPLNRAQAAIFGQYASKNAREYFDNDFAPIKSTQIDDFIESGKGYVEYQKDKKKKSESSKDKDTGNGSTEDVNYEDILDELKGIRANTNIYGESIKNSKMLKTVAYLNELDIPYGEKLILYKQMFPKDRKYDGAIYDYLVSTNNPDIDEILEDLGIR